MCLFHIEWLISQWCSASSSNSLIQVSIIHSPLLMFINAFGIFYTTTSFHSLSSLFAIADLLLDFIFFHKHLSSALSSCLLAAVTWLEYCRYGVKPQTINQSIDNNMSALQFLWNFFPFRIFLHNHFGIGGFFPWIQFKNQLKCIFLILWIWDLAVR